MLRPEPRRSGKPRDLKGSYSSTHKLKTFFTNKADHGLCCHRQADGGPGPEEALQDFITDDLEPPRQ